jgi:hypothetical protein
MEKCMADQRNILHTIKIFPSKCELMCQLAYGIECKVSKKSFEPGIIKPLVDGLALAATRDYPITIDNNSIPAQNIVMEEEDEVQMDEEKKRMKFKWTRGRHRLGPLLRIESSQPTCFFYCKSLLLYSRI